MKSMTSKLSRQLLCLIVATFAIIFIALGVIIPKVLMPVAEENIYNYLREPLELIESNTKTDLLNTEVGYLYIVNDSIITSENIYDIIHIKNPKELIAKLTKDYGKFVYQHNTYYYYTIKKDAVTKVAISNDTYINHTKAKILGAILPIVLMTFLSISLILIIWSGFIVKKIEKLKNKIDNIDNDDYNHKVDFEVDDEMRSLALAIEDMRVSLKNQEEYRNQMYQNISHDFKTPLTVIKSYVEAVQDGVEEKDTALKVIGEQANKLEQKVHSLLYLNKLDYLKNSKNLEIVQVDMKKILENEVSKFKFQRKDIKFVLEMDKWSKYYGTEEHWETILDNLLGNFMRYANTTIKITAKFNKIILYNDGTNIDDDLLNGIFTPFRKGIKGQFGLGLSIVKKTLNMMGYDVAIKNERKGVSFIITRGIHK